MSLRLSRILERRVGDRRLADRRRTPPSFTAAGLSLDIDPDRRAEADRRTQNRRDEPAPELWAGLNATQLATAGTFAATFLFLFWFAAQRFAATGDEGALVDGARRLLSGQAMYRDFFAPLAPGSYWIQAIALKTFGLTLAASRIVTVLDLSALAACICWLVSSRVNEWYGAWVAAVFVLLSSADPAVLLPNSGWDSAAFGTLALTIVASGGRPPNIFLAGTLAAFAVWTTPSSALSLLAIGTILWLRNRGRFWPFLYGACTISAACLTLLALQGSLTPMLRQLSSGVHLNASNYTPYGSRLGGYAGTVGAGAGLVGVWKIAFSSLIALGIFLPAALPVTVAMLFWSNRKTLSIQLLFVGGIAILAASYPHFDVQHLAYSSALFYALGAIFLAHMQWKPVQEVTLHAATVLSLILCVYGVRSQLQLANVTTPVGTVRASGDDATFLSKLQQAVPAGSRTFVFPDLPIAYFLTLGANPTHYAYLQPGRVSVEDEAAAVEQLRSAPPKRVIYCDLPEWQVVKLWPGGDPMRLRLSLMEAYLAAYYQPMTGIPYSGGSVQILEPRAVPLPTSLLDAIQQSRVAAGVRP